jgi:diguanylate cyclase (GGDEF)-like protein
VVEKKEYRIEMFNQKRQLYILVTIVIIIVTLINFKSSLATTWSLMLLPAIGIFIINPSWKLSFSLFFILTIVKYLVEFYVHNWTIPGYMNDLIINSLVNVIIFFSLSYFVIRNHRITNELKHLALKDFLTGAYNRRYLDLYQVHEETNSLLLIDLDYFKKINDSYGHNCGDYILKKVSHMILDSILDAGTLVRLGGEEFAILSPNKSIQEGRKIAEKIRKKIAHTKFIYKVKAISLTVSIGVVEFNKQEPIEKVIEKADQALYQAKITGRNKVVNYTKI